MKFQKAVKGPQTDLEPTEMRSRNKSAFHPGKHAAQSHPGVTEHMNPEAKHAGRMPMEMDTEQSALLWKSKKGAK